MGLDPYEHERVYKEGYVAGQRNLPKSGNPYRGNQDKEPVWDLGWERGNSGGEYDGYA
jgi:hypothetical protein